MIGSFAGSEISPIPLLGPLANHLRSLAILNNDPAITFKVPDNSTILSCPQSFKFILSSNMINQLILKFR